MKVPVIVESAAANVSVPEGFVSVEAYLCDTPDGSPLTDTTAVSLGDPIWTGTVTGVPLGITTTVEIGSDTVTGTGAKLPAPWVPPPQPPSSRAHPKAARETRRPAGKRKTTPLTPPPRTTVLPGAVGRYAFVFQEMTTAQARQKQVENAVCQSLNTRGNRILQTASLWKSCQAPPLWKSL